MADTVADDLKLRFPSDSSYLGISRLNATAVAAGADFNVDELDDLRLAVGEAMAWLLRCGGSDAVVDVRMTCAARRFELTATVEGSTVCDDDPDDLVHAILGATVDQYRVEGSTGDEAISRTIALSKTAADA